jgi:hypothetical protein
MMIDSSQRRKLGVASEVPERSYNLGVLSGALGLACIGDLDADAIGWGGHGRDR